MAGSLDWLTGEEYAYRAAHGGKSREQVDRENQTRASGVATRGDIESLYSGLLGRQDSAGTDYWLKLAQDNGWTKEQVADSFKNAAKTEISGRTDTDIPLSDLFSQADKTGRADAVKSKADMATLQQQMTDYFTPNKDGELTPESINQYADIVKQSLQPEFNRQAQGLSEQYSSMGRNLGGDAYNRALAKLGGDFQSKQFEQSLGLAQANIGTKNQNLQNYLGLMGNQKSASDQQKFDWQNILSNNDWDKQQGIANQMVDAQNKNRTPDWAYWLQLIPSIASLAGKGIK